MSRKNSTAIRAGNGWQDGLVEWEDNGVINISVTFSWLLDKAVQRKVAYMAEEKRVLLGGPAANYAGIADAGCVSAVGRHNPDACFTSYGCPNRCEFCIVGQTEGDLRELDYWEPKPIVCDNNLTACSLRHFDRVVDSLKGLSGVDINQGMSASLITDYQASRLTELDMRCVRLAWDNISYESKFLRGWDILRRAGFPRSKISVYILIGYKDTPEDALYRLEGVRRLGGVPFPMRYQPLDTPKRNSHVGDNWTHAELMRFCRYWANLRITNRIPFAEFEG